MNPPFFSAIQHTAINSTSDMHTCEESVVHTRRHKNKPPPSSPDTPCLSTQPHKKKEEKTKQG